MRYNGQRWSRGHEQGRRRARCFTRALSGLRLRGFRRSMSAACSFWRMLVLPIQRIICVGWGARVSWTVFVPTAGGTISPSWPQAVDQTHTAPIDGAMTFDSPFPAIDGRLGLGISLLPACGQGRALLMAFQGYAFPCFADGFRAPVIPRH